MAVSKTVDNALLKPQEVEATEPPEVEYLIDNKSIALDADKNILVMKFDSKLTNLKFNNSLSNKNKRVFENGNYKIEISITNFSKVDEVNEVKGEMKVFLSN
ncbi:MAG: hypothetical protein IPP81_19135 [Chitinophagaceae bacterium]|nr:hypothetical protein [Chitinophagaceae bacterium]